MSYAGQLRVAKQLLDERLADATDNGERFATAAGVAFESAIALLFPASTSQFISQICNLAEAIRFLESSDVDLADWPESKVPLGQYHLSGGIVSALQLCCVFSKSIHTEVIVARMQAYPNQRIDDREQADLGEWEVEFSNEIKSRRPELASWPAWSLHQWRDETLKLLGDELRRYRTEEVDPEHEKKVEKLVKRIRICNDPQAKKSDKRTAQNYLSQNKKRWEAAFIEAERIASS
ncbi:MAG: hypothetical protein NXI32_14470 [bacterium]|nr:hypothetical protein [bacterium]